MCQNDAQSDLWNAIGENSQPDQMAKSHKNKTEVENSECFKFQFSRDF